MSSFFAFPNPVNEKAARVVAAGVALLSALTLASGWYWLLVPLAYGFLARVLTGPRLSPLGRLATGVIAPRLGPAKLVAGPPKRFAQGMGAVTTTAAAVLALLLGEQGLADALLVAMIVAAVLEAGFAFCIGCRIFGVLMRLGMISPAVCAECADVRPRQI